MATKKTNTFNYLGVPGLSASGKFDNSLYTPATKPKAAPTPSPAVPTAPPVAPVSSTTVDSAGKDTTSTSSVSTPPTTSALPEIDASNGLIRYSPE